jgi:hypothetical protein
MAEAQAVPRQGVVVAALAERLAHLLRLALPVWLEPKLVYPVRVVVVVVLQIRLRHQVLMVATVDIRLVVVAVEVQERQERQAELVVMEQMVL